MSVPEFYCWQLRKTKHDGILGDVAVAVLTFSTDFHDYIDGEGGDDDVLIEIMCTMSNSEIRKICATYQIMFGKRLEQGIREHKKGKFKKLLKILIQAKRVETAEIDETAAKTDAETLRKNLEKSLPDEMQIVEILCARSFIQIKLIDEYYKKIFKITLEKAIKQKFTDTVKNALVAIIRTANNPREFYARRISKAINYFALDGRSLGRLIVVRSEIDLMDIKDEFNRIFRKPLKSCLKGVIAGSYKLALLTLIGDNWCFSRWARRASTYFSLRASRRLQRIRKCGTSP